MPQKRVISAKNWVWLWGARDADAYGETENFAVLICSDRDLI
jgi:hypothetical protein